MGDIFDQTLGPTIQAQPTAPSFGNTASPGGSAGVRGDIFDQTLSRPAAPVTPTKPAGFDLGKAVSQGASQVGNAFSDILKGVKLTFAPPSTVSPLPSNTLMTGKEAGSLITQHGSLSSGGNSMSTTAPQVNNTQNPVKSQSAQLTPDAMQKMQDALFNITLVAKQPLGTVLGTAFPQFKSVIDAITSKAENTPLSPLGITPKMLENVKIPGEDQLAKVPQAVKNGIPILNVPEQLGSATRFIGNLSSLNPTLQNLIMAVVPEAGTAAGKALIRQFGEDAVTFMANRDLIARVTTGQATPEEIAQFKVLNEQGLAAKAGRTPGGIEVTQTTAKKGPMWDILRSIFNEPYVKHDFTEPAAAHTASTPDSASQAIVGLLKDGENKPSDVMSALLESGQEHTPEGKSLAKAVVEAQSKGQNIIISKDTGITASPEEVATTGTATPIQQTQQYEPAQVKPTQFDTPAVVAEREKQAQIPSTHEINTPERIQMRRDIANTLFNQGGYFNPKDRPTTEIQSNRRADIVMGPPAAGKSSALANPLVKEHGSVLIDADESKYGIPESQGGTYNGAVHIESTSINNQVLEKSVENNHNIVMPVVGKNIDRLRDTISKLNALGYEVHLHFNDLSPEKAAQRAVDRYTSTGKFVDPSYVIHDVGFHPAENYDILKHEGGIASYEKYSNDVPKGQKPILLERSQPTQGSGLLHGNGDQSNTSEVARQTQAKITSLAEQSEDKSLQAVADALTTGSSDHPESESMFHKLESADTFAAFNKSLKDVSGVDPAFNSLYNDIQDGKITNIDYQAFREPITLTQSHPEERSPTIQSGAIEKSQDSKPGQADNQSLKGAENKEPVREGVKSSSAENGTSNPTKGEQLKSGESTAVEQTNRARGSGWGVIQDKAKEFKTASEFEKWYNEISGFNDKKSTLDLLEKYTKDSRWDILYNVSGKDSNRAYARILQQDINDGKLSENDYKNIVSRMPPVIDMETRERLFPEDGIRGHHVAELFDYLNSGDLIRNEGLTPKEFYRQAVTGNTPESPTIAPKSQDIAKGTDSRTGLPVEANSPHPSPPLLSHSEQASLENKNNVDNMGDRGVAHNNNDEENIVGEPATENSHQSVTMYSGIDPGLGKFFTEDVRPAINTFRAAGKEAHDLINPPLASEAANKASMIVREALANIDNYKSILGSKYGTYRSFFNKYSDSQNIRNISNYERNDVFAVEPKANKGDMQYSNLYHDSMVEAYKVLRAAYGKDEQGFIENYVRRQFLFGSKADETKGTAVLTDMARRSLSANKNPLKERVLKMPLDEALQNMKDRGIKVKPADTNPENLRQWSLVNARKAMVYRDVWNNSIASNLIIRSMTRPDGMVLLDDQVAHQFAPAENYNLQEIADKGRWYATPDVGRIFNNAISSGLEQSTLFKSARFISNNLNQIQLGLSGFHFTGTAINAGLSDTALGFRNLLEGKPIEAGGRFLRSAVPLASFARDMYRGNSLMEGLKRDAPEAYHLLETVLNPAGGRLVRDEQYENTMMGKVSNALVNGNYIGATLRLPSALIELTAKPLMQYAIPRVKIGAFLDQAESVMRRLPPDASDEAKKVALSNAWTSIDNRFGQLVYDNLFWNKVGKDIALLSTRSVGWNLGTIRELGGGLLADPLQKGVLGKGRVNNTWQERISDRLLYSGSLILGVSLLGAVYQYLHTGQGPQELKDYFYPKNGLVDKNGNPSRVALPTYWKDLYAYAHDLPGSGVQTILHKTSPLLDLISSFLSNKDYYGNLIVNPNDPVGTKLAQSGQAALKHMLPFSIQQYQQSVSQGASAEQRIESFFGITNAPSQVVQSEEQKKAAAAYDQIHGLPGPKTPEQVDLSNLKNTARDEIQKDGWRNSPAFRQLMDNGTLDTQRKRLDFIQSAKLTPLQRLEKTLPKAVRNQVKPSPAP